MAGAALGENFLVNTRRTGIVPIWFFGGLLVGEDVVREVVVHVEDTVSAFFAETRVHGFAGIEEVVSRPNAVSFTVDLVNHGALYADDMFGAGVVVGSERSAGLEGKYGFGWTILRV